MNDFPSEEELELLLETKPVFDLLWDTGTPIGGADVERVYRWEDRYIPVSSFGDYGQAYSTLAAALEATGWNVVNETVVEVNATELSATEVAALLRAEDGRECRLRINGEQWNTRSGVFERRWTPS